MHQESGSVTIPIDLSSDEKALGIIEGFLVLTTGRTGASVTTISYFTEAGDGFYGCWVRRRGTTIPAEVGLMQARLDAMRKIKTFSANRTLVNAG